MSSLPDWHKNNEDYLAAALGWLRLRLERLADRGQPAPTSALMPAAAPEQTGGRSWWDRRAAPQPDPAPVLTLPPPGAVTDEQIAQAEAAMRAAEAADPPPALSMLAERLGLSPFERATLLLCAAMDLDTRTARLCAEAQGDPGSPYPTFALALALFDDPAWDVLSPERPLRYWRLVEISQPGGQPLTTSPLRADERIMNYLKGLNYIDDRVAPLLVAMEGRPAALPASQQHTADTVVRRLQQAGQAGQTPIVQLIGPDQPSKHQVAWQIADSFGRHLYRLPAELTPTQSADLETLARLWQRESVLLPVALYLELPAADPAAPNPARLALQHFLLRSAGLIFVDTRDLQTSLPGPALAYEVGKPTAAEQQAAWAEELGDAAGEIPALLAGQFSLGDPDIRQTAQAVLAQSSGEPERLADRLWDACRVLLRPQLDALAQRLEPRATWDDIVLPPDDLRLLRQIADQVGQRGRVYQEWGFARRMNRGLGISALFAGDSGTGKTMAAEVIANHLRLDLYRIDLSAVVSKYIGETEKNLRRLFDAMDDGGAILFFDEADALFGKRSEIRDSHDRYANIEINYLLQRMEAYRGLAILASNIKSALDTAFLRRLRFIVNFPYPSPAERRAIWQRAFPPDTPTEPLSYDRLARLNLTGGNIHTVAINAAFMAARAGAPVSMALVLDAARSEFRKLDRPINEAEFRV